MTNKIKNKHMESPNQLIKAREKDSIIYLGLAKTVETWLQLNKFSIIYFENSTHKY